MTVLENLVLAGQDQAGERLWNVWFRPKAVGTEENAIIDRAIEVLEYVNLIHVRDESAANLSGGQKKLLEFARTLILKPRIVLLDEPAAGVNRTLLRELSRYIWEQCHEHGITYVIVEHDMDLISQLCDPVIVMSQGHPLAVGKFEEIKTNETVLDAYLGSQYR
jgi:branched-chain amino acid transport system ATP-binding protein